MVKGKGDGTALSWSHPKMPSGLRLSSPVLCLLHPALSQQLGTVRGCAAMKLCDKKITMEIG
jgi:hypothetical protein